MAPGKCSSSGLTMGVCPQPRSPWARPEHKPAQGGCCCSEQVGGIGTPGHPQQVSGTHLHLGRDAFVVSGALRGIVMVAVAQWGLGRTCIPGSVTLRRGLAGAVGRISLENQTPVILHATCVVIPHTQETKKTNRCGPCHHVRSFHVGAGALRISGEASQCAAGQGGTVGGCEARHRGHSLHSTHASITKGCLCPSHTPVVTGMLSLHLYFLLSTFLFSLLLFLHPSRLSFLRIPFYFPY